ncbi:hypothetical protein BU24DRAFT_462414 [Aaosphaeria arxii CBS 175.79]|uniref:Uncharacterized protein n=1 Tax=Aaosphaeria arxii CBS 175.79 TaxID=1450172 RepID=A0A6A5XVE8_9PLEO|nr:uncharacterized protein BU24DRAFT_462414 [Aaosphaeria arxii CBS 175.79]KAF2016234.1 hypothetical protein BU24DRAFT_462414 [Aaosphaeria arxii CBS 175.79]
MASGTMQYATRQDWQDIMKNRSRLKMHELIERLGLRAKWSSNKRGKTNFDSPLVKELVLDMTNIVSELPKDPDELVEILGAPDSLRAETDHLLNKHGAAIWGRMGNRDHLVKMGEPDIEPFYYPRDLYFDNEEDRELIRTVLHWWIGLKACNVIHARGRLDRERKKKEDRIKFKDEHPSPMDIIPPVLIAPALPHGYPMDHRRPPIQFSNHSAATYGHPPRHMQVLRLDTAPHGQYTPSTSASPLPSSDSPITSSQGHSTLPWRISPLSHQSQNGPATDHGPRHPPPPPPPPIQHPPAIAPHQHPTRSLPPLVNRISSELNTLASNFLEDRPLPPSNMPPQPPTVRTLDPELLYAFRKYIYPTENGPRWDESILLRRLETAWRDDVRPSHARTAINNVPLFAAHDRVFLVWIELRRHLADLEVAGKLWQQETKTQEEIDARVQQHKTLMSASRDIVRSWDEIAQTINLLWAPEGLNTDGLLVQAFGVLAGQRNADIIAWGPLGVEETIRWLDAHVKENAAEEKRGEELYELKGETR